MPKKNENYGDQSIVMLKGPGRVRLRPAVIFGSDSLEGCEHSVFEILTNAVDEAKEGFGDVIRVRAYADHSIEIDDHGRGVPLGWNEAEGRYNWELVYCELYAGGKYGNNSADASYEYSLGLNGLGACATQYSSAWMEVASYNGESVSRVSFEKGYPVTELVVEPLDKKSRRTGTVIRWQPDLEVFTDISIPRTYFEEVLKKQSIVNPKIRFILEWETAEGEFDTVEYYYENGIFDYVGELAGGETLTAPVLWHLETMGRDRADKDDYKLKADVSFCISNTTSVIEYYHNSSFLEHGGSPDKAVRSAFVFAVDKYLKAQDKYNKNEAKITFADVEDCLVLVSNSQSTQTSYENQTKKAINNKFIADAMTDFLKHQLEVYFAENPTEAERMANQVLINKRSREKAETTRLDIKKQLTGKIDITNRVDKFVGCRSKDPERRELYIVE
ncbi:MAG: DNA topoisomerase, partial [Clostridia bacterium]|nr:DNA topoisomerase [Clostridia bacterium]